MNIDWASFVLGAGFGFLISTILIELARWQVRRHYT